MRTPFLLVIVFSLVAGLPAHAKKCRRSERLVAANTAVLGGPGLGFDTIDVVKKRRCLRVLKTAPDGRFALVQLGDEKAGWVTTGLVDKELNVAADAKEVAVEGEVTRILVRETALRSAPRFDAKASEVVEANANLTVLATSPDGQWLRVKASSKSGDVEGWVVRFQTAEKKVEEGAEPTAGTGVWTVSRVPSPASTSAVAAEKIAAAKTPSEPTKALPKDGVSTDPNEASTDELPEAPASPPMMGRGQELYFAVGPTVWIEQYRSDAVGDVYHVYDLQSLGGGFVGGYVFRSPDNPFVVDVRFRASLNPYSALEPGVADPTTIFAAQGWLSSYFGWRVHETETVDVDMGMAPAIGGFFNPGFGDQSAAAGAFSTGLYLDLLRPTITARSRLGGAGMMVLEVDAVVGVYTMLPDPGATYADTPVADRPPLPTTPVAGEPVVDPVVEPNPAAPVHLSVGADGRLRYSYPLTDSLALDIGISLGLRQVVIGGPGLRTGAYLQANNVDIITFVTAGITFGL